MSNCCLEDGVDILHVSSQRKRFLDPIGEDFLDEDIIFEFDLPTTSANLNSYAEDIVKYIAGANVGKLKYRQIIECKTCLCQVTAVINSISSILTCLKYRGSYLFPSDEVHKLCMTCERILKSYEHQLLKKPKISFEKLLKYLLTTSKWTNIF